MRDSLDDDKNKDADNDNGCTGLSQECPPPSVKIENLDGGLLICGVLIGPNFRLSLLVFGCLFMFIGIILTIVGYREPSEDEGLSDYENRLEVTNNVRVLGPICVIFGIAMLIFSAVLKYLSYKAKLKQTRIGFYCPVHGDFYPLSPDINIKDYVSSEKDSKLYSWLFCMRPKDKNTECSVEKRVSKIPACPHSIIASPRSSFDSQHPFPHLFIIPPISVGSAYLTVSTDQSFGSIGSFSIHNDVASFPAPFYSHSTPPTSPASPMHSPFLSNKRLSCPTLPEIGAVSPFRMDRLKRTPILVSAEPAIKIVLPVSDMHQIDSNISTVKASLNSDSNLATVKASSNSDSNLATVINVPDTIKKHKSVSIVLPTDDINHNKYV